MREAAKHAVVIGTTSNTYTTPGINSNASIEAQSGPLSVVTTDANGNLAQELLSSLNPGLATTPCQELVAGALGCGTNSQASGTQSTALGQTSTASGVGSTAVGFGATATGNQSIAIGQGAQAPHVNGIAIGAGAATTRDNQVVIGNAANTYTLSGITSAASTAAQSNPGNAGLVTSDLSGNLAVSSLTPNAINNHFRSLDQGVRNGYEGTAIAIAMAGAWLPDNKKFAVSANYGTFRGENGFAATGALRVSDNAFVHGGVGFGANTGAVAGQVGVTLAW